MPDAEKVAGDVHDTAEGAADDVKDTVEGATENAKANAEDTADGTKDTAEETAGDVNDTAEHRRAGDFGTEEVLLGVLDALECDARFHDRTEASLTKYCRYWTHTRPQAL